jgi:membrane-bound metal-dependent hydrolase YbcI (DUF457 family)
MNKLGHSVGGVITSAICIHTVKDTIVLESLMTCGVILGSFIPDLDAEYSTIKSKLSLLGKLFEGMQKILPDNPITCHRGALLHSIWTLIPFVIFHKYLFVLGVGAGILSHHILDMTTKLGLRYFFPYKTRLHVWRKW